MKYILQIIISSLVSILVYYTIFSWFSNNVDSVSTNNLSKVVDLENFWLKDLENEIITTVDAVKESVVSIIISKDFILYDWERASWLIQQQTWWGSGILVSNEGYILTNKHVVSDTDSSYTVVFSDWESVESKEIWLDDNLDIAVIKIDQKSIWSRTAAIISDISKSTQVGQLVLAIGNALAEFQNSVTFWVISWNNRKLLLDEENNYAWLLQTDTAISEWNSWGPLFNLDGEVIAINTAVSSFWENIGFAIPISSEFVLATLKSIKSYGSINRPYMWIRYIDMNINVAKEIWSSTTSWIYISDVLKESPAQKWWIQAEDIITKVDWKSIDAKHSFLYYLFTKVPWNTVEFEIVRWWDILITQVTVSSIND